MDSGSNAGTEFQILVGGTWIPDSNLQWDSVFPELYSGLQSPGYWTSQAKMSKIPDSKSKNGDLLDETPPSHATNLNAFVLNPDVRFLSNRGTERNQGICYGGCHFRRPGRPRSRRLRFLLF